MLVGLAVGLRRCFTAILGVGVGSENGSAVELAAAVAVGISADKVEETGVVAIGSEALGDTDVDPQAMTATMTVRQGVIRTL